MLLKINYYKKKKSMGVIDLHSPKMRGKNASFYNLNRKK